MSTFRGIWVALATPLRAGEIDFAALRGLVGRLLEDGVAGFVVCGTTGEAAALSHEEQLAVLDAVLQWVPQQQVIMGLAGNNLRELLAFQQEIQRRPVAGLLVPAPYYIRPSQQGLEAFFQTVADAASVPLVLYDIPYRTGVRICELVGGLALQGRNWEEPGGSGRTRGGAGCRRMADRISAKTGKTQESQI